jgi:hypothetical protein
MPAFRSVVSVLVSFVVRSFSTNSWPASGRPPAALGRQGHDQPSFEDTAAWLWCNPDAGSLNDIVLTGRVQYCTALPNVEISHVVGLVRRLAGLQ